MSSDKVYQIVTDKILNKLAAGVLPWRKGWVGGAQRPFNGTTGREYNGGNYFLLSMLGYATPAFLTFKQIQAVGGKIVEGQEKNYFPVFYWNWIEKKDTKGKVTGKFPMLRYFLVWNIEQVEGYTLPEKFQPKKHDPVRSAEAIIAGYPNAPEISIELSDRACYSPKHDRVTMPKPEQFERIAEYYSTMFHELGHSTGHEKRLNRKDGMENVMFGCHNYSLEELIAELTAAFLCAEAGIDNTLDNSAAYIASWLKALQDDPKMFWTAAGKAQKAADLILNRERKESED